ESGNKWDGCHAGLHAGQAQIGISGHIDRGIRSRGIGFGYRYRHSRGKAEGHFRIICYDQTGGHRAGFVHRAHDRRDLWRQDLGGEPGRGRRRVSLQPAAGQGACSMRSRTFTVSASPSRPLISMPFFPLTAVMAAVNVTSLSMGPAAMSPCFDVIIASEAEMPGIAAPAGRTWMTSAS